MFMYYLKMLYIFFFFHVYGLPDMCLDSTRLVFQAERHIELSEYISTLRSVCPVAPAEVIQLWLMFKWESIWFHKDQIQASQA